MRSASAIGPLLASLAFACCLAGCATTMQTAARLQLNSARIRASEESTRVTAAGHAARVTRVSLVAGRGETAFVVEVRNVTNHQVSDLPISVGVRTARHRHYLNAQSGRENFYFGAHLPVIGPRRTLTWVYSVDRRLAPRAKPFAIVGAQPSPRVATVSQPPVIEARTAPSQQRARARALRIAVRNLSSVPQYQLQVYAVARDQGRYVAAGSLTIAQLDGQVSKTFDLGLVGRADRGHVELEALPTTLQ